MLLIDAVEFLPAVNKWRWIAVDKDDCIYVFRDKPVPMTTFWASRGPEHYVGKYTGILRWDHSLMEVRNHALVRS